MFTIPMRATPPAEAQRQQQAHFVMNTSRTVSQLTALRDHARRDKIRLIRPGYEECHES
jgi:hypothetical protein